MMQREKIVDLTDNIVRFPQYNTVYRLKSQVLQGQETSIVFKGNGLDKVLFFDVITRMFYTTKEGNKRLITESGGLHFFSGYSMPFDNTPFHLPSVVYGFCNNKLVIYKEIEINLEFDSNNKILTYNFKYSWSDCPFEYKFHNELIQEKFHKIVPNIPVACCRYPIFLNTNRPTFSALNSIYKQFLKFNNKSKLRQQFSNSVSQCAIRAYFLSMLLKKAYGIESFKLNKFYNQEDWKKFRETNDWKFHCVTVVADSKMRYWVMDPYENESRLIRVEKFLVSAKEPRATKVSFHNWVVFDHENGTPLPNCMQTFSESYRKTFQFLCSDAIPNKPQYSIGNFTNKRIAQLKYNLSSFKFYYIGDAMSFSQNQNIMYFDNNSCQNIIVRTGTGTNVTVKNCDIQGNAIFDMENNNAVYCQNGIVVSSPSGVIDGGLEFTSDSRTGVSSVKILPATKLAQQPVSQETKPVNNQEDDEQPGLPITPKKKIEGSASAKKGQVVSIDMKDQANFQRPLEDIIKEYTQAQIAKSRTNSAISFTIFGGGYTKKGINLHDIQKDLDDARRQMSSRK